MKLPSHQEKVWKTILRYLHIHSRMPLASEVSALTKLHITTVIHHLQGLQLAGLLELKPRGRGKALGVNLTLQGRLEGNIGIPLLGSIQAGPLNTAIQEVRGLIRLPNKAGYFGLEITGQSMAPWLNPKDIAIIKSETLSFQGQVAVVRYHDEATFKKVFWKGNTLRLESINTDFAPFALPTEEVEVKAVYSSHISGELVKELLEVFM